MALSNKKSKKPAKSTPREPGFKASKNPWTRPPPPNFPLNLFVPAPPELPRKVVKATPKLPKLSNSPSHVRPQEQLPSLSAGAKKPSRTSSSSGPFTKTDSLHKPVTSKTREAVVPSKPPLTPLKVRFDLPIQIPRRVHAQPQKQLLSTSTSTQQASNPPISPNPIQNNEATNNLVRYKTTTNTAPPEPIEQIVKVRRKETTTTRRQCIRTDRYGVRHVVDLDPIVTEKTTERVEVRKIEEGEEKGGDKTKKGMERVENSGRGGVRVVGPGADPNTNKTYMGDTVPVFEPGMVLAMGPEDMVMGKIEQKESMLS